MSKKFVSIISIVIIIICIILGVSYKDQNQDITNDAVRNVSYNLIVDNTTGQEEYIVYDKDTGKEITRVDKEHQLKIYEIDPDYEEIPVDNRDFESNTIEY